VNEGRRYRDPELNAKYEQEEEAPVATRLPTALETRHRKRHPRTATRRTRAEALLRHPRKPADEHKSANADCDQTSTHDPSSRPLREPTPVPRDSGKARSGLGQKSSRDLGQVLTLPPAPLFGDRRSCVAGDLEELGG
jgi:hypothetical protein